MRMDVMKVAALAIIGSLALLIFKQYKPDWGIPVRLVFGIVLGSMILSAVGELVSFGSSLAEGDATVLSIWQLLLKALGISFVTELAMGVCRDSGEGGLAMWVEMAGKIALLLLSLPLVREVLATARTLSGMGG